MEIDATGFALRSPAALGHFGRATAFRPCAEFQALSFPDDIVPVTGADQGMGNLVKDRIENFIWPIPLYQVDRKFNGLAVINAQPQRSLPLVETE
jgi:hypothetical protein